MTDANKLPDKYSAHHPTCDLRVYPDDAIHCSCGIDKSNPAPWGELTSQGELKPINTTKQWPDSVYGYIDKFHDVCYVDEWELAAREVNHQYEYIRADIVRELQLRAIKATLALCLQHEPNSVIKLINPNQILESIKS